MLVAQRSAQPDRPAGGFAATQLGPDVGFIWPHSPQPQFDDKGYSMDSFGNHDVIPPYTLGADSYPLGRIFIGGNSQHHIDPTVRAFYEAQQVQPIVEIDTSWLLVGHVDEIISFVPAPTPRGWKLLVASPTLARTLLQGLVDAGQGQTTMFAGMSWLDASYNPVPADVTVSALLADTEIMAASQTAQAAIDAAVEVVRSATGLADDEIIEIPILFERIDTGAGYEEIAHMVGTVNLRAANGGVAIAVPHGPTIDGADYFETDLEKRLGAGSGLGRDGKGLAITWVEDWDDYHVLEGEVHCGSNAEARPMSNVKWWEAGR
jgi:protein-arginine deiminase